MLRPRPVPPTGRGRCHARDDPRLHRHRPRREVARQAAAYRSHATSPYAEMLKAARWFDRAAYLADAGVSGTTVAALRARATGQPRG
ncbi:hypothetical protein OIM90_07190 [Streptomyces sp. AD16]|nr:hypothetical protein OIM90_07190 [Streptomyces sp. AD16]